MSWLVNYVRNFLSPHARWLWWIHPLAPKLFTKNISWQYFPGDLARPGKDDPRWRTEWPWALMRPLTDGGEVYTGTYYVFFWARGPWGTLKTLSGDFAASLGPGPVWFTALTKDGTPLTLEVLERDVPTEEVPPDVTKV